MALGDRLRTLAGIAAIGEQPLDAGIFRHRRRHHRMSAIAVLHTGGRYADRQQQPQRIDHQVALASLDLLARVIARTQLVMRRGANLQTRSLKVSPGWDGLPVTLRIIAY